MGYLEQAGDKRKAVEAIRSILNNQRFFKRRLKSKLVNTALGNDPGEQDPIDRV